MTRVAIRLVVASTADALSLNQVYNDAATGSTVCKHQREDDLVMVQFGLCHGYTF